MIPIDDSEKSKPLPPQTIQFQRKQICFLQRWNQIKSNQTTTFEPAPVRSLWERVEAVLTQSVHSTAQSGICFEVYSCEVPWQPLRLQGNSWKSALIWWKNPFTKVHIYAIPMKILSPGGLSFFVCIIVIFALVAQIHLYKNMCEHLYQKSIL